MTLEYKKKLFERWVHYHRSSFHPIIKGDKDKESYHRMDFTEHSADLLEGDSFEKLEIFINLIKRILLANKARMGYGGYGEKRKFYHTPAYRVSTVRGVEWRDIHLGIDIWAPAGTEIYTCTDVEVLWSYDNNIAGDYGPTVLLKHQMESDFHFYTLYGHLDRKTSETLKPNMKLQKGTCFARLGTPKENGNWPPHLHFQVILDLLDNKNNFPGVALDSEKAYWMNVCPDGKDFFRNIY